MTMKLLQIANIPNICGGTGACVYSIKRALPDWDHEILFVNAGDGECSDEEKAHYGCQISRVSKITPAYLESVALDVVIFHNTGASTMPNFLSRDFISIFYEHSALKTHRSARKKCTIEWSVSMHLAVLTDQNTENVFYQPCAQTEPIPRAEGIVIGKLCTSGHMGREKWSLDDLYDFYAYLHKNHPDVQWEFVGCPDHRVEPLSQAVGENAKFYEPAWKNRNLFHRWTAHLHSSSKLTESYGRTVCEAQAAGCIPIVDMKGGQIEQINHGADGYLCREYSDFSDGIKFLKDPLRLDFLREKAIKSGKERGGLQVWRNKFFNWLEAAQSLRQEA